MDSFPWFWSYSILFFNVSDLFCSSFSLFSSFTFSSFKLNISAFRPSFTASSLSPCLPFFSSVYLDSDASLYFEEFSFWVVSYIFLLSCSIKKSFYPFSTCWRWFSVRLTWSLIWMACILPDSSSYPGTGNGFLSCSCPDLYWSTI